MTESIVSYDFQIFNSIDDLSYYFASFLKSEVELTKNKFNLVLSGGNTPKPVYKYLADHNQIKVNWNKINFFWSDERCVPPNNIESNFKSANDLLLSKITISGSNIFRIKGEDNPFSEAKRYSEIINKNVSSRDGFPKFDLILLGLGEDGHVASIFPDQINLIFDKSITNVAIHPATNQKRITLTGKIINNAKTIVFIVTGENKSKVVHDILSRSDNSVKYPASYINPANGKLIWLLDKSAGKKLR